MTTLTSDPSRTRSSLLREALATKVAVADGAMGTMLQASDATLDDFEGQVHEAYLDVGVDCIETNTFGTNLGNLGEYGIEHRICELAEAGARIAREAADAYSTPDKPRWVIGSVRPGTKLPSLGHTTHATLRDAYQEQVAGLVAGGVDTILIEIAELLEPERIGVKLSEEFQLHPEQSTDAIVIHHPEAKYFTT